MQYWKLRGQCGPIVRSGFFRLSSILVCVLVLVVTLLCLPSQQTHAQTTGMMGVNVDSVSDFSPAFVFSDIIKQSRHWGSASTPWDEAASVDGNGWPTTDAGTVAIALTAGNASIDISGTYHLSFNGQANIRAFGGSSGDYQVSNKYYNRGSNTTTADITVGQGQNTVLLAFAQTIRFSGWSTNTGITNVKCIRPNYPADGSQTFTYPFLNSFPPFSAFRTMDMTGTNNSPVVNWSDRTAQSYGSQAKKTGVSWEYVIQLANTTNKDVWINVPHQASDDYVWQLATLFRNTLNGNLNVYVEYSNEVWNYGFTQGNWNKDAAQSDGSLRWDGASDQYQLATRRVGKRIAEISNIFRNVWGSGAINTRVRPVLAWQTGNTWGLQEQMNTISHLFGSPNQYIYALSTAPYMHEGDGYGVSQDTSSVDAIINGLYADSNNNRSAMQNVTTLAHNNGLKHLAYEGGTHTPGTSDLWNRINANRDWRMKDLLLHDIGDNWFGTGGDMYVYFSDFSNYNQFGMWGLSESVFDQNTPRWQAIKQLAGA